VQNYIGKMLNKRYNMLEIIGTGGMAVVYKAYDMAENKYVAVKILKEEFLTDDELRQRFRMESEAVTMLSHKNIVAVTDVGIHPNIEYFVMDLIDGVTLKQYMKESGQLPIDTALYFTKQILSALEHAHSRNIIHRDVKPHNIMILRDGTVKVMDFGIARFASRQNTLTQNTFGSVHYISPEQARGETTDGRADVYSVGVMLYEMLTGTVPFDGNTAVSVAIQHINSTPQPPGQIRGDIPASLEKLILKAMSGNKNKRYASAGKMLEDIQRFEADPDCVIDYDRHEREKEIEATRKMARIPSAAPVSKPAAGPAARGAARNKPGARPARGARPRNYEEEYDDYPRKRSALLPIFAGLIASAVFICGVMLILSRLTDLFGNVSTPDLVEVPALVSMDYDVARETYKDRFEIRKGNLVPSDESPEGTIMEQDPRANTKVSPNSVITVTVSSGPKTDNMIKLTDLEYRQAEILLSRYNNTLRIESIGEYNDDVAEGYVIYTDPPEGTPLYNNDKVIIYYSIGKERKMTKVPSVVGELLAVAERRLEEAELGIDDVIPEDSDLEIGTVTYQNIDPGEEVEEGTKLILHVSNGKLINTGPDPYDPNTGQGGQGGQGGTGDPDSQKSKTVTVIMPASPDEFRLRIMQNGIVVYDETHTNKDDDFEFVLYGNKLASILKLIDDYTVSENIIDFDSTGNQEI